MMDLRRFQQELAELVAIPSVSCATPALDMGNLEVINRLAGWLEQLGFSIQIQPLPDQPNKANLIARLGQGEGGLILAGHTDTVPFDQHSWQQDPFTLQARNDRLYGLGATDMKGFFPAVLAAVRALNGAQLKAPLIVMATADEESSMAGARLIAALGEPKARAAVIGEPTNMAPVRMHKGIMMESVVIRGQSGHSSNPALGNNALEAMQQVMTELLQFRSELQKCHRHPGFAVQTPTLNLGCIHGGDNPNRICADCQLHFDLRALPGMDNQLLHRQIAERLTPIANQRQINVQLRALYEDVPAFEQPAKSELVQLCERLCGKASTSAAFATEAPFYQQLGMETLVLGPGSIDQAHQPNEYIPLSQVESAVTLLHHLIHYYCQ